MALNPPIVLFNANTLPVQVNINNALSSVQINGASGPGWVPQVPGSGGPTWSNTTPGPNVLAPGTNYISITPQGALQPVSFTVDLPKNFQWNSLQLYMFFDSYTNVSWIVLNEGQYVTGNIDLAAKRQHATR
jgi:hypothetical protein